MEISGLAEHVLPPADIIMRTASSISDGKRHLGLGVNKKIEGLLAANMNDVFKADLAQIIKAARDYYSLVSNFDG